MPVEIKGEILGAQKLLVKLKNADDVTRANVRKAIRGLQFTLQRHIKQHLSDQSLHVRSGNLRNSIAPGALEEDASKISGPVGTNAVYGRIQEFGGTIRAKNAQNLTIPLDAVLTGAGVARYTARQIISDPSIGGFTSTFFRNGILFGSGGKGAGVTPLFKLQPSVDLPGRPYMGPALNDTLPEAERRLREAIDAALAGKEL